MMNVLINSTLSSDPGASPGAGDESKQHQQLIKKLKVTKQFIQQYGQNQLFFDNHLMHKLQ